MRSFHEVTPLPLSTHQLRKPKKCGNLPAIAVIHLSTLHHDPSEGQTEIQEENLLHNAHVPFVVVCAVRQAPHRLTATPRIQRLVKQDRKMETDALSVPLAIKPGVMVLI